MTSPPHTLERPATVPFAAQLDRFGDRDAVLTATTRVTYAELADRVQRAASLLGTDRRLVLIAGGNDLDTLVTYLAALSAGHPVLLVPGDKPAAVRSLVDAYDPDVVAHAPAGQWVLEQRREGTAHDLHPELALLLSTSGSTGSPKLVRLSHENLRTNAESIAEYLGVRPTDRAVTTLPLHYCYGLSVVHSHLLRGAALVLTDLSVVAPCFWDLVRAHRATSLAGVPYTFDLLDRVGFADMDLPHLRYVTQAGGRLAPDRVRRFAELGRERGWDLFVMYGQTEATARMAYLPPDLAAEHPGCIGVPVPGGRLRLEAVDELDAAGDGVGELVYSGPNVMLGYAHSPEDLALGRTVHELRTGDLAREHPGGLFEVVGRRSRFLKIVGLRVDLGRVEATLAALGADAVCAGTDERLVVAVRGEHDTSLLRRVVAEELGLPVTAVEVHDLDELPRLVTGKPDYSAVLALSAPPPGPEAAPVQSPARTVDDLRALFADVLERDDVGEDDTFVGLGGDSLSYVTMSVRLEEALGQLPTGWHVTPVRELARHLGDDPHGRRRWFGSVETSVLVRAVAIVLIVGTHAKLFTWWGSAHVLMALAGYNFARFQLAGTGLERLRRQLGSVTRVVVPSVALIALAYVATDRYSLANVALLNAVVGPERWTTTWHFWFVEVLVYILLLIALLLAVPWAGRMERAHRFAFPVGLTGVGLLGRFEVVDLGIPHTKPVLWLFALGWAAAQARSPWQRLAVSAATVLAVPGFFDDPRREALIAVGILLLVWVPSLPSLALLNRPLGVLASSSLYVYLTHWLVYPDLARVHSGLAVAGSLVVGVAYWALSTRVMATVSGWSRSWSGRPGRSSVCSTEATGTRSLTASRPS